MQHTQSLSVLITPRPAAGTLSDMASKPLFIAGAAWPELAHRLGIAHVLRVDAAGHVQASEALAKRLEFSGKPLPAVEIVINM